MKSNIKKKGYTLIGWVDDADRRMRCDIPGCKERPDYEVFFDEEDFEAWKKDPRRYVPLK